MLLLQGETTQHSAGDELPSVVDADVACREARWIQATLRSLPCLRTYPEDKIGVAVDRHLGTTVLRLELPTQLDCAGFATACRWARRAAIDFDPAHPVDVEVTEHHNQATPPDNAASGRSLH